MNEVDKSISQDSPFQAIPNLTIGSSTGFFAFAIISPREILEPDG